MVKSMNQVAHALGKTTIAEFVENHETLVLLKKYGIDFAQGHYLGRPQSKPVQGLATGNTIEAPLSA